MGRVERVGLSGDRNQRASQLVAGMWAVAEEAQDSEPLLRLAAVLGAVPAQGDKVGQLRAVWSWIKRTIRFKRDPWPGREMIRDPETLLGDIERSATGRTSCDCDEVAALGAALVAALGAEPVIITSRRGPGAPWHHVFFGAMLIGPGAVWKLFPMDPQERTPFGTFAPIRRQVAVWRMGATAPESVKTVGA